MKAALTRKHESMRITWDRFGPQRSVSIAVCHPILSSREVTLFDAIPCFHVVSSFLRLRVRTILYARRKVLFEPIFVFFGHFCHRPPPQNEPHLLMRDPPPRLYFFGPRLV